MRVCGGCPNVRFEPSAKRGTSFIRCKSGLPDLHYSFRVLLLVPAGYEKESADRLAPPMWCPKRNEP